MQHDHVAELFICINCQWSEIAVTAEEDAH